MEKINVNNIFGPVPAGIAEEIFEILAEAPTVRIERIVSRGHASPKDFWYDQENDEFVILIKGRARLMFKESPDPVFLNVGDYVTIPARCRHRVEWTDPTDATIWLAVHFRPL